VRFAFTEDQLLFKQTVREFFDKECTAEDARAGFSRERWNRLGELGILGVVAPEAHGGLGGDETDLVLLLEEAGRAALPEPLIETAAAAIPALREGGSSEWLARAAKGEAVITMGIGSRFVPHADVADAFLMQHGGSLYVLGRDAVTMTEEQSVDSARHLFRVTWEPQKAAAIEADCAATYDRLVLGASAELLGVATRCLEMAADYAGERHQFGKPIGSFQAVKHKLADALLLLEFARPVVYRAAYSIAQGERTRARDVSMAKVFAADAAARASGAALQTLGAIGYTQEHALHLWLKRALSLSVAWGTAERHRERVARAVIG
jgi:alkylation response protein AidB-like acyl-CoA dehydrogenase